MPIVRAMRLINAIESGAMNSAALEAALADTGRMSEFQASLTQRGLARRLASSTSSINTILSSPLALAAVMRVDTSASEFANNVVSQPLLSASAAAMKAATLQVAGMKAWADRFPAVARVFTNTGSSGTARVNSVAYGAGLYVAVGNAGTLITSPDLVTWTGRTNPAAGGTMSSVAYANGIFVAIGTVALVGYIITSTDGITWTSRALSGSTVVADGGRNVIYDGTRWVALFQGSTSAANIQYATDPTAAWTAASIGSAANNTFMSIVYKPGAVYMVTVTDSAPASINYYISTNLTAWAARQVSVSGASVLYHVTAGSEYFYATTNQSPYQWFRSRDGYGWEFMGQDTVASDTSNIGNNTFFVNGAIIRTTAIAGRPLRVSTDHGLSWKMFVGSVGSSNNNLIAYANGIVFNLSNTTAFATHIPIV